MSKTYLVGGSVRDKFLAKYHGIRRKGDKDFVVVGSTWDQMIADGFKHVGEHFPVFLHPITKQEYALARRERKVADGHRGFEFEFDPSVTLEEDSGRRDFTMNSLAMDENEKVYDYHGGIADIENRVIRHINSQAFVEDPLRVFRAARFFTQLGFEIHPSTMKLMVGMSKSGMLSELSPDRVWKETVKVLSSEWPSRYFYLLHEIGALDYWFSELKALYGVPQRADHHPECDTFLHTMMALDTCAALTKDPVTRWSLICHDLGKALTDPGKWPQHFKHESLGIKSCNSLCERLGVPNEYRDMALLVTELHIKCHRIMESKPGTIVGLLDRLGVKHGVENLFRFTTACLADARGRRGKGNRRYRDGSFLHSAALVYLSVKPRKDVVGSKVGESLYMDRAQAISKFKNRYAMTD